MWDEIVDYFGDTNWLVVFGFWIPISLMVWKFYAKSIVMGTWQFRIITIICMFFLITIIVKVMGDR